MRMRVAMILCSAGLVGAADPAFAIPTLARRYGVACDYCHQGYPKLNPVGQRFKERGLRLGRQDPFVMGDWLRSVPVSVRVSATRFLVEDGRDSSFASLKPTTAGSVGRRLSYWVDYQPSSASTATTPTTGRWTTPGRK